MRRRFVDMLKRIPWALLLVLCWAGVRFSGINLGVDGVLVWPFVAGSFIALTIEFSKSGDIMIRSFGRDLAFAICATLVLGSGVTLVWQSQSVYIVDLLVAFTVLYDAYVSTLNSFRTALRNMQAGVDTTAADAN